jgi:hypothetical protein
VIRLPSSAHIHPTPDLDAALKRDGFEPKQLAPWDDGSDAEIQFEAIVR